MEKLPNRIDEPPMFLMWSSDEFIPAMAIIGVGIFTNYLMLSIVAAWACVRFYRRKRDGNHRDFLKHWTYWIGLIDGAGKSSFSFKSSFIRRFIP